MIETAMMVALGFFAATLLALLVLPFATHRAARRAEARMRELIAVSPADLAAARDGLRAVAAVEQRRVEQKREMADAARAEAEMAVGRRVAELADTTRRHNAEREKMTEEIAEVRLSLGATEARRADLDRHVAELQGRLADEERERAVVTAKRDEVSLLADERRSVIERLEARCTALEVRLVDREATIARADTERERLQASLTERTQERDLARNELLLATTQRTMLQQDNQDLTRRAENFRLRLQARSETLAETEQLLVDEAVERKAANRALADLKARFAALEARLIETGGRAPAEAELAALRSEITAASDKALEVLSPPDRAAPPETKKASPPPAPDDGKAMS